MATPPESQRLIDRLPPLRGRVGEAADLAKVTWFRVGGPAEVMVRPADEPDLATLLQLRPAGVPLTVIGVGSNLLVRDGGVDGIVVRLGRGFAEIRVEGDRVFAGAAALDVNVAETAAQAGLAGLEFLSGIPGTIGGALRMNGGAYGSDLAAVLERAIAYDPRGGRHELATEAMGFTYRHAAVPEDWTFAGAVLKARPDSIEAVAGRMREIAAKREASQPVRTRTGGSTFTNPPGAKAWELIDAAGCRGLKLGGAQVSALHCNFLINTGHATAADIEGLGEEVRRRVFAACGVRLDWEIRRIGKFGAAIVADAFTGGRP